jgi:hypothetical protein
LWRKQALWFRSLSEALQFFFVDGPPLPTSVHAAECKCSFRERNRFPGSFFCLCGQQAYCRCPETKKHLRRGGTQPRCFFLHLCTLRSPIAGYVQLGECQPTFIIDITWLLSLTNRRAKNEITCRGHITWTWARFVGPIRTQCTCGTSRPYGSGASLRLSSLFFCFFDGPPLLTSVHAAECTCSCRERNQFPGLFCCMCRQQADSC